MSLTAARELIPSPALWSATEPHPSPPLPTAWGLPISSLTRQARAHWYLVFRQRLPAQPSLPTHQRRCYHRLEQFMSAAPQPQLLTATDLPQPLPEAYSLTR